MVQQLGYLDNCKELEAFFNSSEFAHYRFDTPHEAVFVTDNNGKLRYANSAARQLTGFVTDDSAKHSLHEMLVLVDEETGLHSPDPVAACLQAKTIISLGNLDVLIDRFGNRTPVAGTAKPIYSEYTKLVGVILVIRDVTPTRMMIRRMSRQVEENNSIDHISFERYKFV